MYGLDFLLEDPICLEAGIYRNPTAQGKIVIENSHLR